MQTSMQPLCAFTCRAFHIADGNPARKVLCHDIKRGILNAFADSVVDPRGICQDPLAWSRRRVVLVRGCAPTNHYFGPMSHDFLLHAVRLVLRVLSSRGNVAKSALGLICEPTPEWVDIEIHQTIDCPTCGQLGCCRAEDVAPKHMLIEVYETEEAACGST